VRRFTFVPDTYETLARMDPDPKGEWVKAPRGYLLVSEAELADWCHDWLTDCNHKTEPWECRRYTANWIKDRAALVAAQEKGE
jgi:hypothetical protein